MYTTNNSYMGWTVKSLENKVKKDSDYWTWKKLKEAKVRIQSARNWMFNPRWQRTKMWKKFLINIILRK